MPLSILVGDGDRTFREFLIRNLQFQGAIAYGAGNAFEAARCLSQHRIDAIMFDGHLPIADAVEGCCEEKAIVCCHDIPVLLMLQRDRPSEPDIQLLDETHWQLAMPFCFPDLIDTLADIVGKRSSSCRATLEHAGIRFDLAAHRVSYLGKLISLRPIEKRLLRYFLEHPSSPITIAGLVAALSTDTKRSTSGALQQQVSRLRNALATVGAGHLVRSLPPLGYAFGYSDDEAAA